MKQLVGKTRKSVAHGTSSATKKSTAKAGKSVAHGASSATKKSTAKAGKSVARGASSATKKSTATTVKQVKGKVAKTSSGAKTTRRGERVFKMVSGEQQKGQVGTKPGPHGSHGRVHKQGKQSIRQLMP